VTAAEQIEFLRAVVRPGPSDALDLRAMNDGKCVEHLLSNDDAAIAGFLSTYGNNDVYFGVGARIAGTGDATLASVRKLDALYVDFDFKDTPREQVAEILKAFPLQPSYAVLSGGGVHVYWALKDPLADLARARTALRGLAILLKADISAAEPARVLRVPGTINHKYTPPREVRLIVQNAGLCYSIEEIESELTGVADVAGELRETPRTACVLDAELSKDRNSALHSFGRSLAYEGCSRPEILAALQAINASRCKPPLEDREVADLARKCFAQSDRPGYERRAADDAGVADAGDDIQPLTRPMIAPDAFPLHALGSLQDVVRAVHERTQAPVSICASSVLAAVNYMVQPYADIVMPTDRVCPVSGYFITVAETGERKSSADDLATAPIAAYERGLQFRYEKELNEWSVIHASWCKQRDQILSDKNANPTTEDKAAALRLIGPEPPPPLVPQLMSTEPTFEGLTRLYSEGHPSIALFSDEGGQFVGGYAMSKDNRLKTAAAFSKLWSGNPIKRTRQGEGSCILYGRRLAMHILVQPGVARNVFDDDTLQDQGLLTRLLADLPEPASGARPWKEMSSDADAILTKYYDTSRIILETPQPLASGKRNELAPRTLMLNAKARALWVKFVDYCEAEMRRGGSYESIRGFANKLAEHATRLATTLALFDDLRADILDDVHLACGIELAQHYAAELLRIRGWGKADAALESAEQLWVWLCEKWVHPLVSLPDIYQLGPNPIRSRAAAKPLVTILVEHGCLTRVPPADVAGKFRREVWRVNRDGAE
jgi:hypothetical protein